MIKFMIEKLMDRLVELFWGPFVKSWKDTRGAGNSSPLWTLRVAAALVFISREQDRPEQQRKYMFREPQSPSLDLHLLFIILMVFLFSGFFIWHHQDQQLKHAKLLLAASLDKDLVDVVDIDSFVVMMPKQKVVEITFLEFDEIARSVVASELEVHGSAGRGAEPLRETLKAWYCHADRFLQVQPQPNRSEGNPQSSMCEAQEKLFSDSVKALQINFSTVTSRAQELAECLFKADNENVKYLTADNILFNWIGQSKHYAIPETELTPSAIWLDRHLSGSPIEGRSNAASLINWIDFLCTSNNRPRECDALARKLFRIKFSDFGFDSDGLENALALLRDKDFYQSVDTKDANDFAKARWVFDNLEREECGILCLFFLRDWIFNLRDAINPDGETARQCEEFKTRLEQARR